MKKSININRIHVPGYIIMSQFKRIYTSYGFIFLQSLSVFLQAILKLRNVTEKRGYGLFNHTEVSNFQPQVGPVNMAQLVFFLRNFMHRYMHAKEKRENYLDQVPLCYRFRNQCVAKGFIVSFLPTI